MMTRPNTELDFWDRLTKTESGCWEFQGLTNSKGYGRFNFKGKTYKAHRLAYELKNGPIPNELLVLHKCDNPPCCNPDHLFLGTNWDNMQDRKNKGRYDTQKGEINPNSKLTWKEVDEIRAEYKLGYSTRAKISKRFNISISQVSNIINNKSWIRE